MKYDSLNRDMTQMSNEREIIKIMVYIKCEILVAIRNDRAGGQHSKQNKSEDKERIICRSQKTKRG